MALAFDPQDQAFNRVNALYLAHASDVAYCRAPAAEAMERLGLRAVGFRHKVTRTRGYLGVCDTHAVLAFRGSDPVTLQTWVTDLVVRLVERQEYNGRVHRGFSSVLSSSWKSVESVLAEAEGKPLFLTGHSMGGALAVLTACRLAKLDRPAVATYTFGAPRVGDRIFCSGYSLPTYRLVNRLDLVPEMPLASVKRLLPATARFTNPKILAQIRRLAKQFPCYGHVKTLVYMDRGGVIGSDPELERWRARALAQALSTRGKSYVEGVKDHLIRSYIRGLEKDRG